MRGEFCLFAQYIESDYFLIAEDFRDHKPRRINLGAIVLDDAEDPSYDFPILKEDSPIMEKFFDSRDGIKKTSEIAVRSLAFKKYNIQRPPPEYSD